MTTLEKIRAELHATAEMHEDGDYYLRDEWVDEIIDKYAEQEPSRDIKEIAEIMKCDADAETKCKMISNILTDKPHYFAEQEPCDDAVSRRAVLEMAYDMSEIDGEHFTEPCMVVDVEDIQKLPSVIPQEPKWIPDSKRLPDDHDWYVIVVKEKSTGYQYIPRIASHNHDNCWSIIDTEDADKDWLDDLECVAWMPLPKPYEPQESEEV